MARVFVISLTDKNMQEMAKTILLGLNQNIVCFPFPTQQFDLWVGRSEKYFIFSSIIRIVDKRNHSYVMFLTNVDVHNTNKKKYLKK
jgi:hypothetical protein